MLANLVGIRWPAVALVLGHRESNRLPRRHHADVYASHLGRSRAPFGDCDGPVDVLGGETLVALFGAPHAEPPESAPFVERDDWRGPCFGAPCVPLSPLA
jgi:hypothetical protein